MESADADAVGSQTVELGDHPVALRISRVEEAGNAGRGSVTFDLKASEPSSEWDPRSTGAGAFFRWE
jgi:hypothetical protein